MLVIATFLGWSSPVAHTQDWMFDQAIVQTTSRVLVSFLKSKDVGERLADQLRRKLDTKTLEEVKILVHPDVRWGGLHSLEVRTSYMVMLDRDLDRHDAAVAQRHCNAVVAVIRNHLKKDDFLDTYTPRRPGR